MRDAAAMLHEDLDRLLAGDKDLMSDPFPLWKSIQSRGRVFEHGSVSMLTRYRDIQTVTKGEQLADRNAFQKGTKAGVFRASLSPEQQQVFDEVSAFETHWVSRNVGERHERLRRIVHRAFTPRRIAELGKSVRRFTDDLIEELAAHERPDFMAFAYQLPLMVIADMLGVAQADRAKLHEWSGSIGANFGADDPVLLLKAHRAMVEFRAYVHELARQHDRKDADGLFSLLLDAEADERLTEEELTANFVLFVLGGHETTTNLLGNGLIELLRTREAWEQLLADPSLIPNAVDELLRFVSPVQWTHVLPVVDLTFDGTTVPRGRTVLLLLAAANRDPAVFEDPDRLDVTRRNARDHLALGFGPHYCLGASLARLETQIAFETLSRRFPEIELAAGAIEWVGNPTLRHPRELPVRLGPARS